MSKLATLRDARFDAGARYAAALAEFRSAYIDLSAIDLALANGGGIVPSFQRTPIDLSLLRHPDYAPGVCDEMGGNWSHAITAAVAEKLR